MPYFRPASSLLQLLLFAACTSDELPTAPPASGGMAESHRAGHKVVNSLADPGDGTCDAAQCTLREAIEDPQVTEIGFAPGLTGSITLARPGAGGGTLVIEKPLTVNGPQGGMVIQRRGADPAFRIFRIGSGVTVRLTNLTVRNGRAEEGGSGGGITNFGTLLLTRCSVVGNAPAGISSHGGALTLTNSTVARNAAGGIDSRGRGTIALTNTTVADNLGTGISDRFGTVTITHSTIARNADGGSGGGIAGSSGTYTIADTRVRGNSAAFDGGGIVVSNAHLAITNSAIVGNSAGRNGGGIANHVALTTTITGTTVSGNTAAHGGGIANLALGFGRLDSRLTLTNSTVSGNSAEFHGGGIFNINHLQEAPAVLAVFSSTVADNTASSGGGIALSGDGPLSLINSVVARNGGPAGPDVLRSFEETPVLARANLIGNGTSSGITSANGNQVGSAASPLDPRLAPLGDYGGPTATHRLLAGSPAIDAASTPDCPATDQRGVNRPQGPGCDIGSFERIVP